MDILVLSVILALVVGGCVCVVWASRGGPRWARGVAYVVLAAGEVLRSLSTRSKQSSGQQGDSGGSDGS
ncbi:hypothetical protein ACH4TV_16525 [Streptomyces sp. NPDC020898]|uniref:hypothetical protein n=1 Tax=Streptomyces sp. NPDC020898 TaxID=3365101 RepID=UPI0037A3F087